MVLLPWTIGGAKESKAYDPVQTESYQTLRSVSDLHLFVVCKDGKFYASVPEHVRHRGPWQGQHRGELANLAIPYLLDIEEQGYSLVRCELAVFKPEA